MRRRIITLLLVCCFVFGLSTSVLAANTLSEYELSIPTPLPGSMRSTSLYVKATGTSPYVQPAIYTISTIYFLSPTRLTSTNATDIITTNNTTRRNFTYNTGYGGAGTFYCLSAAPAVTGDYDAYSVRGSWSR